MIIPFTILSDGWIAKVLIPKFIVTETRSLSYHFLLLKPDQFSWNLGGYLSIKFDSFPQHASDHKGDGGFEYSNILPGNAEDYKTVLSARVYSHDQQNNDDFSCKLRLKFNGIIRNLYINSEIIFSGSS